MPNQMKHHENEILMKKIFDRNLALANARKFIFNIYYVS